MPSISMMSQVKCMFQVGMAVFDPSSLKLRLLQCIESTRTYVYTL